jgi:hypothetical protein
MLLVTLSCCIPSRKTMPFSKYKTRFCGRLSKLRKLGLMYREPWRNRHRIFPQVATKCFLGVHLYSPVAHTSSITEELGKTVYSFQRVYILYVRLHISHSQSIWTKHNCINTVYHARSSCDSFKRNRSNFFFLSKTPMRIVVTETDYRWQVHIHRRDIFSAHDHTDKVEIDRVEMLLGLLLNKSKSNHIHCTRIPCVTYAFLTRTAFYDQSATPITNHHTILHFSSNKWSRIAIAFCLECVQYAWQGNIRTNRR